MKAFYSQKNILDKNVHIKYTDIISNHDFSSNLIENTMLKHLIILF